MARVDPARVASKREREKRMVSEMIALYCRKRHGARGASRRRGELCPECAELAEYARSRSDRCPFMETKTFCSNCRVHCYRPEMRERIREVMRFSGPRMIVRHPVAAVRHAVETRAEKRRLEREERGMGQRDAIKVSPGKRGPVEKDLGEKNPGERGPVEKDLGEKNPGKRGAGEKGAGAGPGVVRRALLVALGCVGLALGALGAVLPLLPAFPFLMLAAFCFAKSSERLNAWFTGTRLYRDNLESFVAGQGMTRRTKVRIMVTVTALMSVGFVMMHAVPVGRVVLACVWVFHILYFSLGVRTKPAPSEA